MVEIEELSGAYKQVPDGFECAECGDLIKVGENCIRIDRATVGKNGIGEPSVLTLNFGDVIHEECLK